MYPVILDSSFGGLLLGLVILLWILSEAVGSIMLPIIRRAGQTIQRKAYRLGPLGLLNWLGLIAAYSIFSHNTVGLLPEWTYYAGIIVILAGIVVRQWSIAVLGRFFSPYIGVQKDQSVVQKGPYRLVRHPSYTGLLMIELGLGLAIQSWAALAVILAVYAIVFSYRISVEERMLLAEIGGSYQEYMKRTKRLIPFLI